MYPDYEEAAVESCLQENVQELEDAYAQALADGMEAKDLSLLWERIKELRYRKEHVFED